MDYDKWGVKELKKFVEKKKLPSNGRKADLIQLLHDFDAKQTTPTEVVFRYENWTQKSLKEELATRGITTKAKTPKRTLVRLVKESNTSSSPSPFKPIDTNSPTISPKPSPQSTTTTPENKENVAKLTPQTSPEPTSPNKSKTPPKSSRPPSARAQWVPKKINFDETSPSQSSPLKLETPPQSPSTTPTCTPSPAASPEPRTLRPRNSTGCPPKTSPKTPPKTPPKSTVNFTTPPPSDKKPELQTPRSILKSPYKSPYSKKVEWKEVEVRHYDRCHGGSSGVPSKGYFPLGLDWSYNKKVVRRSISEHEKVRRNSVGEEFHRIPEKDRKDLLVAHDENTLEDTSQHDIKVIRKSRKNIGCSCKYVIGGVINENCCDNNKCYCVKHGIECNEDSCGCHNDTCKNPQRHYFDEEKVHKWRRERLVEINTPPKKPSRKSKTPSPPKVM